MSDETVKSVSDAWRYRAKAFGGGRALAIIVGDGPDTKTVHITNHSLGLDRDQTRYLAAALDDVFKRVHHATRSRGG